MPAKRLPLILTLMLAAALAARCAPSSPSLHGSPYPAPDQAPALDLVDTSLKPFSLAALQGHAVLVYFGYTHCPDECPATLANVSWDLRELGDLGNRVDFVLVTIDPANDSPAVLRAFLDRFNPRFIGLSGAEAQLAQARAGYGVLAATPDASRGETELVHSSRTYLVGPNGQLLTSYDLTVPKEDILADLRLVLTQD